MALINCPECTKEISDTVKACPHCGFALQGSDVAPQQVEVTAVNLKASNPEKTKKLMLVIVAIIIAAAAIGFGMHQSKQNKEKLAYNEYIDNLETASSTMLNSGAVAEKLANLTASVWNDAIYKKSSSETAKFVISGDFNRSLALLSVDEETIKSIAEIEIGQEEVEEIMKRLNNPIDEFKTCYDTVGKLYEEYLALTKLAINPTGSYQSFVDDKRIATDEFLKYRDKLASQIPEKKE